MGYRILFVLITVLGLFLEPCRSLGAQKLSHPLSFSAPQFQIEELSATVHSDGRLLVVSGCVKNNSFAKIRGFVTVYFKSSDHSVLNAVDVEVNDNKLFDHGQSGRFETSTNIENIKGLANVSVEFTETGRSLILK